MQPMDEDFSFFYHSEGFGPAINTKHVPQESLDKFKGKLPDQLLSYWQQYGWSGYGQGLFWLVDPDEYAPALEAWIGDTPLMKKDTFYVIGRSAFGQLFLWGTNSGQSLKILSVWGAIFPRDQSDAIAAGRADELARYFIQFREKSELDLKDHLDEPLFDRALEKLGPLAADEMYAFEPMLAFGAADLKNLRKVKAVAHLVIMAQLSERKIMPDIVKKSKATGLL